MLHARVPLAPFLLDPPPAPRSPQHLVAAAVLAVFQSGCFSAWAIQHPPSPPIDTREPLQCTRNVVAPAVDTGIALLFGTVAVALIVGGQGNTDSVSRSVVTSAGAMLGIPTVLSALSAGWGYASNSSNP